MTTQAVVNKNELWTTAQNAVNGLGPHYQAVMGQEIQRELKGAFFPIFLAQGFAPEPFSAADWNGMFPYTNIQTQRDTLKTIAEQGFLKKVGEDTYQVTEKGTKAAEAVFSVAHDAIADIKVLEDDEMERLAGYLQRIVEATLASSEPAFKDAILSSRWTDPGNKHAPISRVDQYLTDLNRYRDDAHISSFVDHGVPAHAWEAFSLIWRGEQDTPAAIVERLPFRNHDADSYVRGLDELVSLGWLTKSGDQYSITDKGKAIREEAEAETDRYFFIGWSALSESELADMANLLGDMQSNVNRLTAEATYGLLNEVGLSFFQAINDDRASAIQELGFEGNWFLLFQGIMVNPDSVSAADLQKHGPYANIEVFEKRLKGAAEQGWYAENGNGTYKLTDKGQKAAKKILKATWESFAKADVLDEARLNQILGLMQRISSDIIDGNVANNNYTAGYDNLAPPEDEIPLVLVDHQSDLLRLYRDDAHHAVWQDLDVEAHVFEAFTVIWQGEQNSAEGIAEHLTHRGYTAEEYDAGLKGLVKRGWLTESGGKYSITEKGKQVREEAEVQTDDNYYQPWMVLDINEQTQLFNLMFQLRNAAKDYSEKVRVEARNDLYDKLQNCVQKFFPLYTDQIGPAFEKTGLRDVQGALGVLHWAVYEDKPFDSHLTASRFPYSNPENFANMIKNTLEAGYIAAKNGGYIATDKGRDGKRIVDEAFHTALSSIGDQCKTDIARIHELLSKAMTSCLESTENPPGTKWLSYSEKGNPSDVSLTGKIDHIYDNFNAFRDDAHLATWRDHDVDGRTWETLTLIYNGDEIKSGADLQEKRGFRGHSEEAYSEALENLVERGWIELKDGKYVMTEDGQTMRDESERLTNLYFYRPWFVLNSNEAKELRGLLEAWESELQTMVDAKEAEKAAE